MDVKQQFALQNGAAIPAIGFGTWQLVGADAVSAVSAAIQSGYRLIDTAASYANEPGIAKGIVESGIPREELFIQGKLWNTKRGYDPALTAFSQTLKRLRLDYIDCYLIHWPASPALHDDWREINRETWRAMETLLADGLVRTIGVCNYLPHHLDELLATAKVVPMINQIECHPGFSQQPVLDYSHAQGILPEAWSPFGEGTLIKNETLQRIAAQYQKSVAQLCLRWCLQKGAVPLPKSKTPQRMAENLDVFDFEITADDMNAIDNLPFSGGSGYDPDTITKFG